MMRIPYGRLSRSHALNGFTEKIELTDGGADSEPHILRGNRVELLAVNRAEDQAPMKCP
jgi:hypothetical protein